MRKQKRDPAQKAFVRGYQAGVSGKSRDLCPNQDVDTRQYWMSGWREGRSDSWSGMTGVAGIHKNPTVMT